MAGRDFYDWLIDRCGGDAAAQAVQIGLVWTLCRSDAQMGLAMTPQHYSRTLAFPGTLAGTPLKRLAASIRGWEPFEASVAMAAINAAIHVESSGFDHVVALPNAQGNLSVFDYFLPRIKGARIVVIGRYPGMDAYEAEYDLQVIERFPGANDYPDPAAEFLIPEADWVFLTASSIPNKTFPRLAELSRDAITVLMGPTTPWLPELSEWGIDFLAGVVVNDQALLAQSIAEGGGRAIFDAAVSYRVADIGQKRMQAVKQEIAELAERRDALKYEMGQWYEAGNTSRFPMLAGLEQVQADLSRLDTQYKYMWDVRHA